MFILTVKAISSVEGECTVAKNWAHIFTPLPSKFLGQINDSELGSKSSPDCDPFIQLLNEIRAALLKHHKVLP